MPTVAVLGYGYWGPNLARNLAALPDAHLMRICDTDPLRRAEAARRHPGVTLDPDPAAALADPALDAVVIATPLSTHFPLASAALQAGKHVLLEKPMVASTREAAVLVELAARVGQVLMVDHPFAHGVAVEELCRRLAGGELGRLLHYDSVRANLGPFHADTNVIWDLAVHDLAILERLTGRLPDRVSATVAGAEAGPAPIAHLLLHYADGLLAHLHLSWLSPVKLRKVTLAGSRALVTYDELDPAEKLRIYAGTDASDAPDLGMLQRRIGYRLGDMVAPRLPVEETLQRVCANFMASISGHAVPLTDGHSGLRSIAVLEAASRSLQCGGVIVPVKAPAADGACL